MDTLPVWKRIYPVIASSNPHVTTDVVEDVLNICKQHLTDVFLQYKPYSKESFNKWKEELGVKQITSDDEMCNFIHNLSKKLNLDSKVAWIVICNFLMYEYYGKVDELKTLIKFNSKLEYLTENIWYFYSADRMFLLKTLRHILEGCDSADHKYDEKIKSYLQNINSTLLWKNLLTVFSNLIHEISDINVRNIPRKLFVEWIHRNNREQVEVILLLTHTLNLPQYKLTGLELEQVFTLFMKHGFTGLHLSSESLSISRKEDLEEIKYAEIALILTIIHKYWNSTERLKVVMLPQTIERNLELLQIQNDNSIILFAWTLFKAYYNDNAQECNMDNCNMIIEKVLEKKMFMSLYGLLIHKMFTGSKVGAILVDAVHTLVVEFSKNCADFGYFHEQPGVTKITAELLKQKGLIVLDNLGPIFQLSMEAFPFVFEPFLEMCKSLLIIPEKYDNVVKLLKSIPGFLAEIPWSDCRSRFTLSRPQKLFIDSDLFIVPAGTTVERYLYQGQEYARFIYPFSFFLLMEQFTKSFSTITFEIGPDWYCYKNLTKLVHIGFKFINHLLKHYKGDYRHDSELRTLVERLEIVPVQFCQGPVKNFDFIKLYFEVNCTLITYDLLDYMEAFPPIQRKAFMPNVVVYNKDNRNGLYSQLHNKSLLYQSLKDEEGKESHSLLLQYLELIYFMVKKNAYHYEVQLPGVWYIINCTLPLYQQWHYEDPSEKIQISKYCFSIMVEILNRHLSNVTDASVVIFEMVLDSFMFDDITLSSYMSVLSKDKFYLQNLMEQESNWSSGANLEILDCLRLQLVLLILLFKHKAKIVNKKNNLDDNVGFFAKAVTPYIINPYSLALRKLSCRFLELLAKDQNIPLMALLGLDYDQVQRLYLDRLRDSTEDDDLKVHILDLIGTCVIYQHGMTAAFFNVTRSRKWYSDNKEKTIEIDTVSDFMVDYLHNVKRSPEFLRSPLQIGILHVMANLWSSQKKHLISDVVSLKEFWPLLSNPLYREFDQLPKIYAFIFQIYSIQLAQLDDDPQFLLSIEKFVTDAQQIQSWIDYVLLTFKTKSTNVEDIEDRKFLLKSWMEFIIMLERCSKLKKFTEDNKFRFISMTLEGLQLPFVNTYCIKNWTDFLLLQLSYWKLPNKDKENSFDMTQKTIKTVKILKLYYNDLEHSTRLSVLTIVQQLLDGLQDHFKLYCNDLLEILEYFGPMLEYEYLILEENSWTSTSEFDVVVREQLLPWMVCVKIVNGLFEYENLDDISLWFSYRNIIHKYMNSACQLVKDSKTLPLVKMVLYGLGLYASSSLAFDFLNVNINTFFVKMEPFVSRLLQGQNNKISPLQLEEMWVTCSLLIKFETAYFQSLQHLALNSFYNFLTLNEQIFLHVFNVLETSVALKALDLVQNALVLIDSVLMKWRVEWYRKSNATYNFVLNGVKKIVNACLYAILRPKNIAVYQLDEANRLNQLEKFPVELMVAIMNRLVTVTGLGFSILYRTNPNLVDILDVPAHDVTEITIENDFGVPKFELPISSKLTYGMLLCLSHFLCKTMDALALNTGRAAAAEAPRPPPEDAFPRLFGMVEHQDFSDNPPTQKLSAFLRYAMYEYSGLADPWIQRLDFGLVRFSLEALMVFLAQQIFLAVRTAGPENVSYFRRNLSSELQFFYEHVKKITSVLVGSERLSPACKAETDILRKYLVHFKETKNLDEVVDKNFCIVISYWFVHLCKLRA